MTAIALVVPANVRTVLSGGNLYDLRLAAALGAAGHQVTLSPVDGPWPVRDPAGERSLASALERLRKSEPRPGPQIVLVDGLIGAASPDVIAGATAAGMDVRILVHLPLALEPGLDDATAAQRGAEEQASLRAASSVIATSAWTAAELRRRYGITRLTVAPPGVDPAPQAHGSTPPRLVQVGALIPGKNQLDLVHALAGLSGLPWTVHLIGSESRDPHYAGQVRQAIREAGLELRITLTGERSGSALEAEWQAADLSVLPSSVETFGMVVTESLARGVPVVVSVGTGSEEALGYDTCGNRPGFTVPPGEPAELRRVLGGWLRNPETRAAVRRVAENRRDILTGWDQTARDVTGAIQ